MSSLTWRIHLVTQCSPASEMGKRNADILRTYSANYRERVKIDNENLTANTEKEMLTAAQER